MAGRVKYLRFSDGTTVTAPTNLTIPTLGVNAYVDDAAYVTAKGSAAAQGDLYFNTTLNLLRYYNGTSWVSQVDETSTQNVSGKTFTDDVVFSSTGAITVPSGSDAQQPGSPTNGMFRYNTDNNEFEGYAGGAWGAIAGGSGSGGINLIGNPDGASALDQSQPNDNGDWIDEGTGTTSSITTTTADIPLYPNKETGIQILVEASGSGFTRYRFTMPDALVNHGNMPLSWFQNTVGSYADDSITVSLKSYSDSAFSADEVSHSFVDGWDGTVKNFEGKFTTAFAPDGSNLYYELQFARTGGAANEGIVLNDVRCGPDPVLYAPVLTQMNSSYTPSITASTDPTKGTTSVDIAYYRRSGDCLEVHWAFRQTTGGTTGTGDYEISLPDGLTVDSSKVTIDASTGRQSMLGPAHLDGVNDCWVGAVSTTSLAIFSDNSGSIDRWGETYLPLSSAGRTAGFNARIPIAEWAGQAQHLVGQNDVEYAASTTGTWDADAAVGDTVYGPNGATISGALTTSRTKVVRFQTPVTATDDVVLQVKDNASSGGWIDSAHQVPHINLPSAEFGAYISDLAIGSTDVTVTFRQYAIQGTTYNNATGTDWNGGSIGGTAWRLVKRRSGIVTNYGTATDSRQGLLPRYQTETVALDNSFTAGSIKCERIGDTVTITADSTPTHSSSSGPSTSSGLVPAAYRPSDAQFNLYVNDASVICLIKVDTDGTLTTTYRNYSGTGSARTDALTAFTITYTIT